MAVESLFPMRPHEADGGWRTRLPTLEGDRIVLRQLLASDAPSLLAMISPPEVSRFISPPPQSVPAFEQFVATSLAQQAAGRLACFALMLKGHDTAIGVFQVRSLEPSFKTAEWGFAIGAPFWGTGIFEEAAELVLAFAFTTLGVHRLEARAAIRNGRGNRALHKVGAVPEGVLRQAFLCDGEHVDQMIYGLVEEEWRAAREIGHAQVTVVH